MSRCLGAVDFRGLGEDRRSTVLYQQGCRRSEGRVGGDPGIGVRAAALQGQGQGARRHGLATGLVGDRKHVTNELDAVFHGLAGATGILQGHRLECRPALEPVGLEQEIDLVDLAAKADHENPGEIRMLGETPQNALQIGITFAGPGHAATGRMRERDHPVDMWIIRQEPVGYRPGDVSCCCRRAVHAGQHTDIIAGSDAAIRPHDPLESATIRIRHVGGRLHVLAEGIVPVKIPHLDIVDVNMVAGCDVGGGKPDDLVVFADGLATGNCAGPRSCGPMAPARSSTRPHRRFRFLTARQAALSLHCPPDADGW